MIAPLNRVRNILALADDIRERHGIVGAVRARELRHILQSEGIGIMRVRRRWYVEGTDGAFIIAMPIGAEGESAAKRALHEYAHIKRHMTDGAVVARQLFPCVKGDPRETEADLLAALLWHGASATPDHPAIAKLVAKLEGGEYRKRTVEQLPLSLPEIPRAPRRRDWTLEHEHMDKVERQLGGPRLQSAVIAARRRGLTDDEARVRVAGKHVRYIDRSGYRWWVTDSPGGSRRVFYNARREHRVYSFRDRYERRDMKVKHLDRQLKEARAMTPAPIRTARQRRSVENTK